MRCMATGRCGLADDAMALRDKLYESDGIILASPSFGVQPDARMKNFLTDRIGMFTVYTSSLGGKYFAGISTAGAEISGHLGNSSTRRGCRRRRTSSMGSMAAKRAQTPRITSRLKGAE